MKRQAERSWALLQFRLGREDDGSDQLAVRSDQFREAVKRSSEQKRKAEFAWLLDVLGASFLVPGSQTEDAAEIQEMVGWCWLGFGEGVKAAERFERAEALVGEGETASAETLAGLAAARWLAGQKEEAIATYLDISQLPEEERGSFMGSGTLTWPISAPPAGTKPGEDVVNVVREAVLAQLNEKMTGFSTEQSRPDPEAANPENGAAEPAVTPGSPNAESDDGGAAEAAETETPTKTGQ